MDLRLSALRGASITLVAQGARFVIQIATLVVLARLLEPRDFGLVAMVTAVLGVAEIIRDFGLSSAAMQAKSLTPGQRDNLFWLNTGLGAALAALAVVCAPLLAALYDEPRVTGIVLALSWLLIVTGANTQLRADLARRLQFAKLAWTDIGSQLAGAVVAIVAAASGWAYWAIVAQQTAVVLVGMTMNVVMCRWRPGLPRSGENMGDLVRFGGGVFGLQLLGNVTNNIDNVAIGAVWGPGPLGYYSRAYQLLVVPLNQIAAPLNRVMLPTMSRLADDKPALQDFARRSQLVGSYGLGIAFAVGAGLAAPLTDVLFGARWAAVAPIFAVLAVGGIFRGLSSVSYWIFLSVGEAAAALKLSVLTKPFMIALLLAGLPWGPFGVAVGHTVGFGLNWAVQLRQSCVHARIEHRALFEDAVGRLLLVSLPAGLAAFAGTLVVSNAWLQVVVGGLASLVWLVVSAMVFGLVRRDAAMLLRAARRATARGAA